MGYMSGFAGSMTAGTGLTAWTGTIEEWIIFQDAEIIEARAKGDAWKTKFLGSSEWRAEIRALVDDAVAASALLLNQPALATLVFVMAGAKQFTAANALLSNVTTESPVDGPVIVRGTVTGSGALAQA